MNAFSNFIRNRDVMYLLDIKSMLTIQSQQEPSGHNRNHPVTTGTIRSQ